MQTLARSIKANPILPVHPMLLITVSAINLDTNVLTVGAGHGFANGFRLEFSSTGALPAGLSYGKTYYVTNLSGNTFTAAATAGGTTVDITDAGSGTISVVVGPTIVHVSPDGKKIWAFGGAGTASHYLYYSTDGVNFTYKSNLGNVPGIQWYEQNGNMIMVLPNDSSRIIATGGVDKFNASIGNDGIILVSSDGGANFTRKVVTILGGGNSWNMDANNDYVVVGVYGRSLAAGTLDRDVWMSTDSGDNWFSCFHIEGDGSSGATYAHIHMSRIDPDGGCWVSVGDSSNNVGLWHSPAQPIEVSTVTGHQMGNFVKIYTDGVARPIVGIFYTEPSGEKYYYVGEDTKTGVSISRIRYDAVTITSADAANDRFNLVGHSLANGDVLRLYTTGSLPTGFTPIATNYYVVNAAANTFQLSATSGGAAITFSADDTGTHSYNYQVRAVGLSASLGINVATGAGKITEHCWLMVGNNRVAVTYDAGHSWSGFTPTDAEGDMCNAELLSRNVFNGGITAGMLYGGGETVTSFGQGIRPAFQKILG